MGLQPRLTEGPRLLAAMTPSSTSLIYSVWLIVKNSTGLVWSAVQELVEMEIVLHHFSAGEQRPLVYIMFPIKKN